MTGPLSSVHTTRPWNQSTSTPIAVASFRRGLLLLLHVTLAPSSWKHHGPPQGTHSSASPRKGLSGLDLFGADRCGSFAV